jgi:hypothetical protein
VTGAKATDGPFVPGSGGRAGDKDAPVEARGRTARAGHERGGNPGRLLGTGLAGGATAGGGCPLLIEVGPNPDNLPATEDPNPRTLG